MPFHDGGIWGCDVSKWQSIYYEDTNTWTYIDWNRMKESGMDFVFIKVGQNIGIDPTFEHNWKEAKRVGIPRASYWYLDPRTSAKTQAQKYWSMLKDDPGEGPLVVDYEQSGLNWDMLYNFIVELQNLSGYPDHRIWIYTGYYFWIDNSPLGIEKRQWFAQYPLWLAWYGSNPEIPDMWTEMALWQSGTPTLGLQFGCHSKEIDFNRFNGDETIFQKYFTAAAPLPPPVEEPMTVLYKADLKASAVSNVRNNPGLTGTTTIYQLTGPLTVDIVSEKVTMNNYDWYKISHPVVGYIALTSSYENFRSASPAASRHVVELYVDGILKYREELA